MVKKQRIKDILYIYIIYITVNQDTENTGSRAAHVWLNSAAIHSVQSVKLIK